MLYVDFSTYEVYNSITDGQVIPFDGDPSIVINVQPTLEFYYEDAS